MTTSIAKKTACVFAGALGFAMAGNASAIELDVSDFKLDFYGYIMAKAAYDLNEDLGDAIGSPFTWRNVEIDGSSGDDDEGHFSASALQSRFGFKTELNGVVANVEGDFVPGQFRLRHAYFAYEGLLLGQTWSNYTSFVSLVRPVELAQLTGTAGGPRVAQLRYTVGKLSLSIEEPTAALVGGTAKDALPVFTGRYSTAFGPLRLQAGAAAQSVGYKTSTDEDEVIGYGAFIAGGYDFGGVKVSADVHYSDGLNSYVYGLFGDDGFVDADGDVETIESLSGAINLSAKLGPGSLGLGYGQVKVDYPDAFSASSEQFHLARANYWWSPRERISYAVEYNWYGRQQVDGNEGDASRVYFAAMYTF